MARLEWDRLEDRDMHSGLSKGVLYVGNRPGVAWNGLVSLDEQPDGGEVEPKYQDGLKVYNKVSQLEYAAELTAFTYPEDFELCLGLQSAEEGLYVDEQDRSFFGLSYQTKVIDALQQENTLLHLVYNAVATPSSKSYSTITDVPEPTNFSWSIATTPVKLPSMKPASHYIIDERRLGPHRFEYLTDILYGTSWRDPRLMSPDEIYNIIHTWKPLYPETALYPSSETIPGGH